MTGASRRYTDEVPGPIEIGLRALCLDLHEAYEERAWVGTRWMVRKRTFAHVLGVEDASEGIVGRAGLPLAGRGVGGVTQRRSAVPDAGVGS